MEHLEGVTLAVKLKDKRPLPLADALDILSQTCAAIDEAHRLGILHRDLKPENIWLEPVREGGCNVKVLDFGIAQLHDLLAIEEPEPLPVVSETYLTAEPQPQLFSITEDETLRMNLTLQQLTRAGSVMGSPKYMSPEQCRGEKLDNASDIYSLGVIAYQMLSGDVPFKGTVSELLQQHREAAPAPLSKKRGDIPATLDAVVRQALAKEPSARPATAGAFAFLLSLQHKGNNWMRQQADAINRRHKLKLTELAVRLQWPSWLLTGLVLMATVKLPGLRPLQAGLVFGFLWLLIAAITYWKQNSVTAACALFLEQTRKTAKTDVDTGAIVRAIRRRTGALARATWAEFAGFARKLCSFKLSEIRRWADSLLIVPSLMQERLSVDEAKRRSARLVAPLRRKLTYPFFRRLLAFALVLTAWQMMLVIWGVTLDGGRRELAGAIIFRLPLMLALCFTAFSLSLKSSIEQAVLYLTARQALGEITAEEPGLPFRQDAEARLLGLWLSFKTYAPTCALLLLTGVLHFLKFDLMWGAIRTGEIHTVKALQAAGVPLQPWHNSERKVGNPNPFSTQSRAMAEFLLEKGMDVNIRLVLGSEWTPPGIGMHVKMTPLHLALTSGRVETARLLIKHGADVHARDSIGRSPLIVAITYCPSAIELLLASGVDIKEQTRFGPPLLAAARYQWLYPRWPRRQVRENAVKILLENGADPNTRDSDGRNALMVMSMEQRPDGFLFGLPPPLPPPPPPPPPPTPALAGPVGVLRPSLFIRDESDFRIDREHNSSLQLIGEALLQAGCDVNAADSNGRTPLMYAARYSQPTAIRLLQERGADAKAKDKSGLTAVDLAIQIGNREIMKFFLTPGQLENIPRR
jgi:ankyrin repeat protein